MEINMVINAQKKKIIIHIEPLLNGLILLY